MYPEHIHIEAQARWQLSQEACKKASENSEIWAAQHLGRKPTIVCKALCTLGNLLIAWGKYILKRLSQSYPGWEALEKSV